MCEQKLIPMATLGWRDHFLAFSAQAQTGHVKIVRGMRNQRWFRSYNAFPEAAHDDSADSTARACNALIAPPEPAKKVNLGFMAW